MSSTAQAVKNAAAALKKAADPWNKEDREIAERLVSASISMTDSPSLDQDILNMLSGLLRRPFAELYLTHPGAALRLSAAIFTTMVHDKIVQSWKARDSQSRSSWEQVAVVLLAGVQDHVEAHSNERVKIAVAQAYYAIICNALFSASSSVPLSTYSVPFRVSAYSLLSMTADGCVENKNKLRDSKILGGAKLGRVITSTKDYLTLEQLLILLAYLLPPTEGRAAGRAERLGFLRDCFADSTQSGKDLIELLKYVASPDWEITADKIIDILARDISVAQPFIMKNFVLIGSSNSRLNPANRFYLDRTSFLFNCEDEDGKIEGMHLPYDSIRSIDISSSGTVVAQLLYPPQCHETLQIISNVALTMTVMIASNDVERFAKTLRIRGMTSRIKLNGMSIQRATHRTSIIISPTRLEFEDRAQSATSYQSKVKAVEEGVLQASDPGDVIVPNLEVSIDKLQDEQPLLVKECTSSQGLPSSPTPATTHGTKVHHDGGCHHVSSVSGHQLPSLHEDPQKRPTTSPFASGPPPSPRSTNYPPLHSPCASGPPYRCYDGNNAATVNSSPSGHSHNDFLSDKVLSDAIFRASDEELSSLSDTDSILSTVQSSLGPVKSRRVIRGSGSSKHCSRSQRRRHPHLSARLTSPTSNLYSAQDPAPEQKLAPMVKKLRVIDSQDSQDSTRDKLKDRAAAVAKRKKVLIDSEEEIEATTSVPPVAKELPPIPTSDLGPEKKAPRKKRQSGVTTQGRVARPRRACVARADVELKPHPSAADSKTVEAEKELTGGRGNGNITPGDHIAEHQKPARMAEQQGNGLATEGDDPATSTHGLPRKRARVEPENISSPRNRPQRRSKKDAPVVKPRKAAPSRVRKTYRKRQKTERPSPRHCVNRAVDYDEIPPSTAAVNSPTAKGRTLPPKKSFRAAEETHNDKKQKKGEPKQTEVVLDDDDPIQSFSSSPSELLFSAVDAPKPQVSLPCDADVRSDCASQAGSPKSLDVSPTTTIMRTGCMENVITETNFDMTSQPTACDNTLQYSTVEDGSVSVEIQSISFPTTTSDEDQGISKGFTDLDYLDGSTIIAEQPTEPHGIESISVTPKPIVETIDLTGSTPSPMRLPIVRCVENITFPHDVPTSSPASKSRTAEDSTDSSMLDLTDIKYRDFNVSLDSSLCLPSTGNRTSSIRRPPTPPPPRTKRKSVTFAAPLEKVVEERLETQATLTEAMVPDHLDGLECLELAPGLVRGSGSSLADGFHCLSKRLVVEPQPTHLSPRPASPTAKPLSLLFSPVAPCQSRQYATEAPPSTTVRAKQKHRACDASTSPSAKAEFTAPGSYLIPIMTVLDEIHTVVKGNIQTRFERFNGHVVELRRQVLARTKADMTALLDEYILAYNDLVNLEAKYGAFSGRRIAAFAQARNAHAQSLIALRAHTQTHDRVMQEHARHTFTVGPLPASVRRWL